jgi:hypothetical protein
MGICIKILNFFDKKHREEMAEMRENFSYLRNKIDQIHADVQRIKRSVSK